MITSSNTRDIRTRSSNENGIEEWEDTETKKSKRITRYNTHPQRNFGTNVFRYRLFCLDCLKKQKRLIDDATVFLVISGNTLAKDSCSKITITWQIQTVRLRAHVVH